MTERDWGTEIDQIQAELRLMRRLVTESNEKANEAFAQAELAAERMATLIQRLHGLKVADPRVIG